MRVYAEDFKAALALFESEFIGTFSTSLQKFLAGAALAAAGPKIDEALAPFTSDGLIETDAVKALVDEGMRQCGGQFELPISFGVLASIGAAPITIRIKAGDMDKFFGQTVPATARAVPADSRQRTPEAA